MLAISGTDVVTLPPTDLMTVSHPTLNCLLLLGGFRLETQGNAEAKARVAVRRNAPVPERRPTKLGPDAPTAASFHAVRALFWTSGIADCTFRIITVPVATPVRNIPVHVV